MSKLGDDFCLRLFSTSPAPKRDYQGLTVTTKDITLNSWDISHGPHIYPRRRHMTLDEFCDDRRFQDEITIIFGPYVVDYTVKLARGEKNVHSLPEKVFLSVLKMLAVNDILHLRQTSKIFFQLCNSNPVWKILYEKRLKHTISESDLRQSETMPWQYLLRKGIQKAEGSLMYKNFVKNVTEIVQNIKKESKSSKLLNGLLEKEDDFSKTKTSQISEKKGKSIWSQKNISEVDSKRLINPEQKLEKQTILKNTQKLPTLSKSFTKTSEKLVKFKC